MARFVFQSAPHALLAHDAREKYVGGEHWLTAATPNTPRAPLTHELRRRPSPSERNGHVQDHAPLEGVRVARHAAERASCAFR